MDNRELMILQAKMELSRRSFWEYCKFRAPDFYTEDRPFLRDMSEKLQWFVEEAKEQIMVINLPPRHGKSRTATAFVDWLFGKYGKTIQVMTGSYNETLSSTFAKQVRDTIAERPTLGRTVFSDIFPGVNIKYGEGSAQKWALEGSELANYLATSPSGTATGFGCFVGETEVFTDKGVKTIEEIYEDKSCDTVLSFDLNTNSIRYNKIIAKRKLKSVDIVKVRIANGTEIECTADHRFYTKEKGWIRADQLRNGDTLVAACYQPDLREMREAVHEETVRGEQGNQKRVLAHLLFPEMLLRDERRKPNARQMRRLREDDQCTSEILFSGVQGDDFAQKHGKHRLSDMWRRVSSAFSQDGVLFRCLQEQSALGEHDRGRKLPVHDGRMLPEGVPGREDSCAVEGRSQVSDLWSRRTANSEQEIWVNNEFACASQGRKHPQQFSGQPCDAVQLMPYSLAQDEKVIGVEHLDTERYVYDIQVENDENFFANGVLVHNCNIMLIDDLIKNAEEAYNEAHLQKLVDWFTNTMLSRCENGFKIIIIMTRWCTGDLAGFVLENYPNVIHINYKAVQDDGSMLCNAILSEEDYALKIKNMNKDIVAANYQQEPIDVKGRLYTSLKTYTDIPRDERGNALFSYLLNYTDTADKGSDYLCSICYGMYEDSYYILDVLYSKDAMEKTEPATAKMLTRNKIGCAIIESNNGGRGFARNVARICKELRNKHTNVKWFTQSKNKEARILSNSASVMANIYFPVNWEDKWPEFAEAIRKYQREGKNTHDDAPDALTGVYENPKPLSHWVT